MVFYILLLAKMLFLNNPIRVILITCSNIPTIHVLTSLPCSNFLTYNVLFFVVMTSLPAPEFERKFERAGKEVMTSYI